MCSSFCVPATDDVLAFKARKRGGDILLGEFVRKHVHGQVRKASPKLDTCPAMQKLLQTEEEELQYVAFQCGYLNEYCIVVTTATGKSFT